MKNINSIAIVGGGSSGWMTAANLIAFFPEYKITLIESPNISTVGVGESTQGAITDWVKSLGIDHKDFMEYTDASYKMSIKFTDFHQKGDGGFHYPFGQVYLGDTQFKGSDWFLKKAKYPETPIQDYCNTFFPQMALVNKSKINTNRHGIFNNFDFYKASAFHFDATKFGLWLRDRYALPRGVEHITKEVSEIKTDENGISALILDDGTEFTADLYIDCTGFKSLLLEQTMGVEFEDMSDELPCNHAWATQIPYVDPEKEIENYTNCTALGYGWVWNIPLYTRIGTGYVFSDKFTTKEEALEEFKLHLKNKTEPIYAPDRDFSNVNFNLVKFRTGIHKELWHKNVIAIGLSAAFVEPLESNGLYTVHEFLRVLVKTLSKGYVNGFDKESFTHECTRIFKGFFNFVRMHYTLSRRDDTDFWKYMTESKDNLKSETYALNQVSLAKTRHIGEYEMESGVHCIAVGQHNFPFGKEALDYWNSDAPQDVDTVVAGFIFKSDKSKKKWEQEADESLSHYEYLKKNFHGGL
jgi:flavin-dependent dehydrogenase